MFFIKLTFGIFITFAIISCDSQTQNPPSAELKQDQPYSSEIQSEHEISDMVDTLISKKNGWELDEETDDTYLNGKSHIYFVFKIDDAGNKYGLVIYENDINSPPLYTTTFTIFKDNVLRIRIDRFNEAFMEFLSTPNENKSKCATTVTFQIEYFKKDRILELRIDGKCTECKNKIKRFH